MLGNRKFFIIVGARNHHMVRNYVIVINIILLEMVIIIIVCPYIQNFGRAIRNDKIYTGLYTFSKECRKFVMVSQVIFNYVTIPNISKLDIFTIVGTAKFIIRIYILISKYH